MSGLADRSVGFGWKVDRLVALARKVVSVHDKNIFFGVLGTKTSMVGI